MAIVINGSTGITTPKVDSAAGVGGIPAFSAWCSSAISHTGGAPSKIPFQTEEFDTTNAFDSVTNYRFQPLVAGYYQFTGACQVLSTGSIALALYKNGSSFKTLDFNGASAANSLVSGTCIVFMNGSTDYVELFATPATTGNTNATQGNTYFQGVLVRAA